MSVLLAVYIRSASVAILYIASVSAITLITQCARLKIIVFVKIIKECTSEVNEALDNETCFTVKMLDTAWKIRFPARKLQLGHIACFRPQICSY